MNAAPLDPHRLTLVEGSGEWSALYLDGDLVEEGNAHAWGDHHVVHEHLLNLLGVQTRQTECLVAPAATRDTPFRGVASTLEELDGRERNRAALRVTADEKRQEAQALLEQADEIDRSLR